MTSDYSIDELVSKIGNRFLLTSIIAKRAIQVKEGDTPLVEGVDPERPIEVAIKEVGSDRLEMGVTERKEITPSQAIFEEEDELDELEEDETQDVKKEAKKRKPKALPEE